MTRWIIIGLIVAFVFVQGPTAVLFGIGMMPTVVSYLTERDREKYASITIGATNLVGVMPFAIDLWMTGVGLQDAWEMATNGLTLLTMYCAAGAGWLIYTIIPPAVVTITSIKNELDIKSLLDRQRALVEEWGHQVTIGAPLDTGTDEEKIASGKMMVKETDLTS